MLFASRRGMLVCTILLVLAVRLAAVFHWPEFKFPDEFWYTEIAQNVIDGKGYVMEGNGRVYAVSKAPALPYSLAVVGTVIPLTPFAVKVVNQLMNIGGLLFLAGTVRLATKSDMPPLILLLIGGFFPPLIYTGASNYPQNGQLLMLGALFFSMAYRKYRFPEAFLQKRWMVLDGVLIGLGGLFVPTHIYILPGLWLFWFLHVRDVSKAQLFFGSVRYATFGLVGVLLVLSPWIIRNAMVEKAFIPFTVTAGQQFYIGYNACATMNSGTKVEYNEGMKEELDQIRTGKEFEEVCWRHGWEWIREHKAEAAKLTVLKMINYFRWDNGGLYVKSAEVGSSLVWIQRISSLFALTLFLPAFFATSTTRRWSWTLVVMLLYSAIGHGIFISRYRYRIPFEPLMMMVGLLTCSDWVCKVREKRRQNAVKPS